MFSRSQSRFLAPIAAFGAAVASVLVLAGPAQAASGSIAGIVVNDSSAGVAWVDLTLYKKRDGEWDYWDGTYANGGGRYKFEGLTPGRYRVCANVAHSSPGHFERCWKDGSNLDSGKNLRLAAGQALKGKRITLPTAGSISGVVNGSGPAHETVEVAVVDMAGTIIEAIRATIGTTYTVGPLTAGSYKVQFERASQESRYAGEFYNGLSESDGVGAATVVNVAAETNTPSIDATLSAGGTIAGFTKSFDGDPIQHCSVIALADDGVHSSRYAGSSATGRFVIKGLSPGDYKVVVLGCSNVDKWFDDSKPRNVSPLEADADEVSVTDGVTTGIGTLKVKNVM